MCGITGFIGRPNSSSAELRERCERMMTALRHRGPDDEGSYIEAENGLALGFRRLSIVDLSSAGHQPMHSASGRYVIVFNGEIYNFEELRKELAGVLYRGHSDTEVMLAAFEAWGVEPTLRRLNGMFAIALWDKHERQLFLARDRFGEKPLYYGRNHGTFFFGSELKALCAHPEFVGEIAPEAIHAFLRYNYVPTPLSIYQGIHKLPPGHWVRIALDAQQDGVPQPYWSLKDVVQNGLANPLAGSDAELIDEFHQRLKRSTRSRMLADVPLGAFLSGGIDSSTVVALMQAQSARPVRSFSIGFHEKGFNEAHQSAQVARHLQTEHTEFYATGVNALDEIPKLARVYDEPFADSSQVPTMVIARMTRQHVTVALTGDGGDELLGGYNRYLWHGRVWNAIRGVPQPLRRAGSALLGFLSVDAWNKMTHPLMETLPVRFQHSQIGDKIHKLRRILGAGTPEDLYRLITSTWTNPSDLTAVPPEHTMPPPEWLAQGSFVEQMMYYDALTYLPDDILAKVDRATMAASLESRTPYLDHEFAEFVWRLPSRMKIREGKGKWILREVLKQYVPEQLFDRPKMGFGIPLGEWMRGPLREWCESFLSPQSLMAGGYLRPEAIRKVWQEHLSGIDHGYQIWSIVMLQAWLCGPRSRATAATPSEDVSKCSA
jgi:asparagine synthase (glutamine-hydrolysing)